MKCPACGHRPTRVLDSRATEDEEAIRRRRECGTCGYRFTTYERAESKTLVVIKKDGRREAYDPDKILAGMVKACEKRPIPLETLEQITQEIEDELRRLPTRQVSSGLIGEKVLERLRRLDEVAYVRFASVNREFEDARRFVEEVATLTQEREAK
ncbi:MAG TPA: transcriptional repressor NrdR [Armatimonadetes bacterium]|nr:transcriptional repressor NrdR [Armatimonadota bacterium]